MAAGLDHRKGGGDDSIPSRKSLSDMMSPVWNWGSVHLDSTISDSLNCKIGDCSDAHCLASNCTRQRCIPHDSSAKTNSDLIQVLVYTQFRLGNAHVLNINKGFLYNIVGKAVAGAVSNIHTAWMYILQKMLLNKSAVAVCGNPSCESHGKNVASHPA